jgi:hypothetical protein
MVLKTPPVYPCTGGVFKIEERRYYNEVQNMQYLTLAYLKASMSEWLQLFNWQVWATLTFRSEIETKDTFTALRRFERFINKLQEKFKVNLKYVAFVERFHNSDMCHLHVLIKGFNIYDELYKDVWKVWFDRYGRSKFEIYDVSKGAEYYVTKYVTKDICDWRIKLK